MFITQMNHGNTITILKTRYYYGTKTIQEREYIVYFNGGIGRQVTSLNHLLRSFIFTTKIP